MEKLNKKSKLKNFFSNLKKMFSHENIRNIKEQGLIPLGGTYDSTSRYLSTAELFQIPDYMRCVTLIANAISSIDFLVQKKKDGKWVNDYGIEYQLLNKKPNQDLSGYQLKRNMVFNWFSYGKVAIYIERDPKNFKPKSLIPIFSNYIERIVIDGIPQYKLTGTNITETTINNTNITGDIQEVIIPNEDIIWIPFETLDNISNAEFRTFYSFSLNKVLENDKSTLNSLQNDMGISMFVKLKNAADAKQKEEVANQLRESTRRMKQSGMFAFVGDEKMSIENNPALFQKPISIELRKYVSQELASKFGIPVSYLGIEQPNISTSQLAKQFIDLGVKPILDAFISKLEYSLFRDKPNFRIKYSLIELAGITLNENVDIISKAINTGAMTINEAREMLGLESMSEKECSQLFANSTLLPIDKLGTRIDAEKEKFESESLKNIAEVNNSESNNNNGNVI